MDPNLIELIQDKGLGIAVLAAATYWLQARIKRTDSENKRLHEAARKESDRRAELCEEKALESRFRADEIRKEQAAKIDQLQGQLYDMNATVIHDVTAALADSTAVVREICGERTPSHPMRAVRPLPPVNGV